MISSRRLVVGAIIVDDLDSPGMVLAARRTSPPSLRGRWEFPGGKVEDGESPEDALRRELREELGVGVTLGEELMAPGGRLWPISTVHEMRLWFAFCDVGELKPGDSHDEVRWLTGDGLESVAWLEADLQVLPHLALR